MVTFFQFDWQYYMSNLKKCTEPDEQLLELYRLLKLKNPPLKRTVKICVVHFDESKKIDT